jgi:hypothetical protein
VNGLILPTAAAFGQVTAMTARAGGYPRAGVDVGGGIHAAPAQSVTTAPVAAYTHPTDGTRSIIPIDAAADALLTPGERATVVTLPEPPPRP